jgi:hypothetical protein
MRPAFPKVTRSVHEGPRNVAGGGKGDTRVH